MKKLAAANLKRVRGWYRNHLGGTQKECAQELGISVFAVGRHVLTLRAEWRNKVEDE